MIYVDDPMPVGGRFNRWSHLWSAEHNLRELHAFAARLGLKRVWFQAHREFPHYDVSPGKRALALRWGAVEKDLKEFIREKKGQVNDGAN